jgi:RNA polymerase sigma-70 factor, ECF subfamily
MVSNQVDAEKHTTSSRAQIAEMVEKAQAGDQLAFHRLVDQHQSEIYRMIFYRTGSQMDAEDLTQDVFLKAYKNLAGLKSPLVFRSWLFSIAVNRVRDYYRRKQFKSLFGFVSMDDENFQESTEMTLPPDALEHMERKDFWRQVAQMLTSLSHMEKEVFLLRFFDQLSINEISVALKKSDSTIKTHLYRALGKVKEAAKGTEAFLEGLA